MKRRAALGVLKVGLFAFRDQLLDRGDIPARRGVVEAGIDAQLPLARRRLREGVAHRSGTCQDAGGHEENTDKVSCHGSDPGPQAG